MYIYIYNYIYIYTYVKTLRRFEVRFVPDEFCRIEGALTFHRCFHRFGRQGRGVAEETHANHRSLVKDLPPVEDVEEAEKVESMFMKKNG